MTAAASMLTATTPLSTRFLSAIRYLVSPRRSKYRRQNAKVPKLRSIVASSCFARGNLHARQDKA